MSYISDKADSASDTAKSTVSDPARVGRAMATGGVSEGWKAINDPARKKADNANDAADEASRQEYQQRTGTMEQMGKTADAAYDAQKGRLSKFQSDRTAADASANLADSTHANSLNAAEDKQQGRVTQLMGQASDQATKANATYTNTIQPSLKNAMETADQNASQAMSLKDAGDMNNPVQQGVRSFFDQRAANEGKSGLQDVGMLQSLGAQATANQMGSGNPMTGGQLAMLSSQNNQQGGQAFANVQQRMQGLRQQGIDQGISQSNAQYARGQLAGDTAARRRGEFMGAEGQQASRTQNQRGEQYGYGSELMRSQKGQASNTYNSGMSQYQRGNDQRGQFYNQDTGLANQRNQDQQSRALMQQDINLGQLSDERMKAYGQMQSANAEIAGRNAMLGAGIQTAATGVGAYAGGAQGAQIGNSMGAAMGGGVSQQMNASNPYAYNQPQQRGPINTYGGYGQQGGYG